MDQTALAVFSSNSYSDGMSSPNAWISIYKEPIALHGILLLVARHTCNSCLYIIICAWTGINMHVFNTRADSAEVIIRKHLIYTRSPCLCRRNISPRSVWARELSCGLPVGSSHFVRWITGAQVWRHTCTFGQEWDMWIQEETMYTGVYTHMNLF